MRRVFKLVRGTASRFSEFALDAWYWALDFLTDLITG